MLFASNARGERSRNAAIRVRQCQDYQTAEKCVQTEQGLVLPLQVIQSRLAHRDRTSQTLLGRPNGGSSESIPTGFMRDYCQVHWFLAESHRSGERLNSLE